MSKRKMNGDTLEIYSDSGLVIKLREKMINDTMNIEVLGEIRNDVAHDFEDEVMAVFSVCNKVRIDMSGVTYIASLAMRSLLSLQQIIDENEGAVLSIANLSVPVKEAFDSSGFAEILNIEN